MNLSGLNAKSNARAALGLYALRGRHRTLLVFMPEEIRTA